MTVRMKILLVNQINHLLEELENASNELDKAILETREKQLSLIKTNISIAQKRTVEFQELTIKELEKRHQEKMKKLRAISRCNKNS